MRGAPLIAVLAACGIALGACASSPGGVADQSGSAASSAGDSVLNVFAAASLTEAFGSLETSFEAAHPGIDVVLNLAGSQDLLAQMAANGGADVLATANEATMESAREQGLVDEPELFAMNTLTLITPPGNPAGVTGLDSSLEGVALVVCAPEVPCGALTRSLADSLGVELRPVSEEQAVTDVRGKVASGEADAGIVYMSDARAAEGRVETIPIPGAEGAVNAYPIAVASATAHPGAARAWVEHVLSEEGRKALSGAGFTVIR